jgi:hypothetical protein
LKQENGEARNCRKGGGVIAALKFPLPVFSGDVALMLTSVPFDTCYFTESERNKKKAI